MNFKIRLSVSTKKPAGTLTEIALNLQISLGRTDVNNTESWAFPYGSVVKNLMQGHRFHPWSGKIPQAAGEPSLCAATGPEPSTAQTAATESTPFNH